MNKPFSLACDNVGGQNSMARHIGTSQANVWAWLHKTKRGVPAEYCHKVAEVSGVSIHELRPDVYPADPARAVEAA